MNLLALIPLLGKIFDRVLPDAKASADAKLHLLELAQTADLAELDAMVKLAVGQLDTNRVEAESTRLFVSGWRPFIGWVCGGAFAYKFVAAPFIVMLLQAVGISATLPNLDFTEILPVLIGMLGLGGYRTIEKLNGVG